MNTGSEQAPNTHVPFEGLLKHEPNVIAAVVPVNAVLPKELYLAGKIRNPSHEYLKTADAARQLDEIDMLSDEVIGALPNDFKHTREYEEFIDGYEKKALLIDAMHRFKTASDKTERVKAKQDFMELNVELHGAPDESLFLSFLNEKLNRISHKNLSGDAALLYGDLLTSLSDLDSEVVPERFKPSDETVEWMHDVVETLYGDMLSHVPDQDTFNPQQLAEVFRTIIAESIGDVAAEWSVDVEDAKAIMVRAAQKRIIIPVDRGELSRDKVRKLVVHEIGVHMLRSLAGGETNIEPLAYGLEGYYDTEEGLGVVMEQALAGKYTEAGIPLYLAAGLAHFKGYDFRAVQETLWRLSVLEKLGNNESLDSTVTQKAKATAYGTAMRIFRGTDELPWFKDLAYYNGAADTWQFLESIRGDDYRLSLLLLGKLNTSPAHLRTILESKTA